MSVCVWNYRNVALSAAYQRTSGCRMSSPSPRLAPQWGSTEVYGKYRPDRLQFNFPNSNVHCIQYCVLVNAIAACYIVFRGHLFCLDVQDCKLICFSVFHFVLLWLINDWLIDWLIDWSNLRIRKCMFSADEQRLCKLCIAFSTVSAHSDI